jgi:hypothetical protein
LVVPLITKSAAIGYSSDDWTWIDLPKRRYLKRMC